MLRNSEGVGLVPCQLSQAHEACLSEKTIVTNKGGPCPLKKSLDVTRRGFWAEGAAKLETE